MILLLRLRGLKRSSIFDGNFGGLCYTVFGLLYLEIAATKHRWQMDNIATKRKRKQKFLLILILLTMAFIWGHSMMPRTVSSAESGQFVQLLAPLWEMLNVDNDMADHIVRKCAHFLEYAVLGGEICLYVLLGMDRKPHTNPITQSAITALFVALTDETIQIFSNRGSQVQDVWLDFFGACMGSLVVYGVWRRLHEGAAR